MRKTPVIPPWPGTPDAAYDARLWRKARACRVDMAGKRWCDLSQEHFGWHGFDDRSGRDRRRHPAALLAAFRRAQVELRSHEAPCQLFAS